MSHFLNIFFLIPLLFFSGCSQDKVSFIDEEFDELLMYPLISKAELDLVKEEVSAVYDFEVSGENSLEKLATYLDYIFDSPIPVYIGCIEKFNRSYLYDSGSKHYGVHENLQGVYVLNLKGIPSWPEEFIFLTDSSNIDSLIASYIHEKKHYMCRQENCICRFDSIFSEIHAYEYELLTLKELGLDDALKTSMHGIAGVLMLEEINPLYTSALFILAQEQVWKDCLEYLREKERVKN